MSRPSSAREALIVEALGDVALLLDRVETLTGAMDSGRLALTSASSILEDRLKSFQSEITSITQTTKTAAVDHIVKRTVKATHDSIVIQSRAIHAAAKFAFSSHAESHLAAQSKSLQLLADRVGRPWEVWVAHAATAIAASATTWLALGSSACR